MIKTQHYLLTLLFLIACPTFAQKKGSIQPIYPKINFRNQEYFGEYIGETTKIKIDKEKINVPNGAGKFMGYVAGSGIQQSELSDDFGKPNNSYLSFYGSNKDSREFQVNIANNEDFNLESDVYVTHSSKNAMDNTGGGSIKLYCDDSKKQFLQLKIEQYKLPSYYEPSATLLEKSAYAAGSAAFKNVTLSHNLNGEIEEFKFKAKNIDYEKFNHFKIVKFGKKITVFVNGNEEETIFLDREISVKKVVLWNDQTHNVYFDFIKLNKMIYKPQDRLVYDGNWAEGVFNGNGILSYDGLELNGLFKLGLLEGAGIAKSKDYYYEGMFVNGIAEGKGKINSIDFDYEGDVKNWWPENNGKMTIKNNLIIDGQISKKAINQFPIYEGQFKAGKINGTGKMTYRNGDVLEGTWNNYLFTGKGKLVLADGAIYDGDWFNGKRAGKGKLTLADGSTYDGDWVNGKRTGKGKLMQSNGNILEGDFKEDLFTGTGKIQFSSDFYLNLDNLDSPTKGAYEGAIKDGLPNGNGVFISEKTIAIEEITENNQTQTKQKNLYIYDGLWINGKKQGQGKLDYWEVYIEDEKLIATTSINFVGNLNNDVFEGMGQLNATNSSLEGSYRYNGSFKNGDYHGIGDLKQEFSDGSYHYVGSFENGEYNGKGKLISQFYCKSVYEGDFVNGSRNGFGKIIYENSCSEEDFPAQNVSSFEGEWENGTPKGQGKKVYKNGKIENGEFRDGEFIKPYSAPSVKIGTQTWMTQNLTVTNFRNGDPILEAKTASEWSSASDKYQAAFCYYNNDPSTAAKFGVLYNYYALIDPRGLAPEGWKLPDHNDVNELRSFLNKELIDRQNKILEAKSQGISTDKMRQEYNKVFSSKQIFLSADFKLLPSFNKGAIHFLGNTKFTTRTWIGKFEEYSDPSEHVYWTTSIVGDLGYVMSFSKYGLLNSYSNYSLERGWMSDHWLQEDNSSEYKGVGLPVRLMKMDK